MKVLGIRPFVDYAFCRVYADALDPTAIIAFLNAVLLLKTKIVKVTIRNPINLKDFEQDKLTVLDINAEDQLGRIFDVEMQLTVHAGVRKRMAYYGCDAFANQLREGDDYTQLKPVYVVCILMGKLWKRNPKVHHQFQLIDRQSGRTLKDTLEIHTLELGWYNLAETDLATATPVDRWLYWLLHAHQYSPEELLKLFPEEGIQSATKTLIAISEKTEDKQMYDAREKAARDYRWAMNSILRKGEKIGEARGEARGEIRLIQSLQDILQIPPTSNEELESLSLENLRSITEHLRSQIKKR
jgi:predicted transposase/invertase (TIGR01784 family)